MNKSLLTNPYVRLIALLPLFFLRTEGANAQVANYVFSQTAGTYTSVYTQGFDILSSGSPIFSTTANNTVGRFDFPFFFYVNGVQYYDLVISSNGFVSFGSTSPSSTNLIPISSAETYAACIAAMGSDLAGGGLRPKVYVSGLSPNRVLTVEFKDYKRSGQTDILNFQYKFYETTNIIQVVYGNNSASTTGTTVQVGLRGATNADYKNRTGLAWATTTAGTGNNSNIQLKNTAVPASGLTFTFTPSVCTVPLTSVAAAPIISGITASGLTGTFTGNASTGYLVLRTESATAPTPVSGCNYIDGSFAAGGYVESIGAATTWTSTGLASGKQYWFWVYPYNATAGCSLFNTYKTTAPATATATTLSCTSSNNTTTVSSTGTTNWTACTWSLGHVPTPCESVTITYTGSSASGSVLLDVDVAVKNLTIINASPSSSPRDFSLTGFKSLIVDGDLTTSGAGAGNRYSRMSFNVSGRTRVNGNVVIGTATFSDGLCTIGSTGNRPEQTYLFKGTNVTFQRKGLTIDEHARFIFDGVGTQNLINNSSADSATDPILFEQLYIGGENATTLNCSGTWPLMDVNDRNRGGVQITAGSTLVLPANISLNGWDGGCYFVMEANSTLKLGGAFSQSIDLSGSIKAPALTNPVGSNFPLYFEYYQIDPTATIEYNGLNNITQTIYDTISYPKLVITNGSGSGRAPKITTRNIQVNATTTINSGADLTLGNTWNNAGSYDVLTNGGLYCAANVVSGTGAFTLNTGGYLGMGHAQGISSGTTSAGNIQMMGGRSFSTGGNYIYNGAINQITGNGLPTTCNDLTIANTAVSGTVTISANQNVNGTHSLQSGTFVIDNQKINVTGPSAVLTRTAGFMKANKGILEINNTSSATAQSLSGTWFTNKTISTLINSHIKGITVAAAPADTLLISSALLYGTTGSVITTNDNVTLLSRDTATARFGDITGNTIAGKVTVERYLPTLRKWRHLAVNTNTTQSILQSWMENNVPNGNTTPGYGTIVTDEQATWSGNGFDSRSVSGPSLKYYNDLTNNYTGVATTGTALNAQNSYYNFVRGDRSCTPANSLVAPTILRSQGTLKTGTLTFNITGGKFASIGNPYASAVDLRLISRSNVGTFMYVWDPKLTGTYGLGAYQTLSFSGGNFTVIPGGGSYGSFGTKVDTLESGQAFFVKSPSTAGTVVFNETNKTAGARTMSRGPIPETVQGNSERYTADSTETIYTLLSLMDAGVPTLVDGVMADYANIFSNAVDSNDAEKMMNMSENVSFKRENSYLAIERRHSFSSRDTLFINISGMRLHQYKWDIVLNNMDASGRVAKLVDNYLNTITTLSFSSPNAILFDVINSPGSYAQDRFMIVFSQAAALPVKFTGISAIRNEDRSVTVKWNTETEISMSDYIVEHSTDGRHFSPVSTQPATVNNGGRACYIFNHIDAGDAVQYYRVRGNSISGQKDYTSIVKAAALKQTAGFNIYPNPVENKTVNLQIDQMAAGIYMYRVINNAGQINLSGELKIDRINTVKAIPLPDYLASGDYVLQLTDSTGNSYSTKFLLK